MNLYPLHNDNCAILSSFISKFDVPLSCFPVRQKVKYLAVKQDEFHVLFHCTKYTELRLKYFTSIPEYNLLLNNNLDLCVTVSDKDKLNTLMNNVNKETILSVANFIFDMNILRKKICNVD